MSLSEASYGRTSHEVRGLKSAEAVDVVPAEQSHLTRGAWIEIERGRKSGSVSFCRTSHEVRGLKYL